ncbi:hypothetical protein NC653_013902 [Populus alba x Populus x berolinensis]|uniref:Uncharacterized protein n=1 Tax=Populus alba x Populus x berolinensis TaxID=444605 RepID=A0AAD6QWV9_9ROSI|nr:hypothetical protein NC653_013902 [Populus alba x Populus x berolinensis]
MPPPPPYQGKSEDMKLWGVVIFGLIGPLPPLTLLIWHGWSGSCGGLVIELYASAVKILAKGFCVGKLGLIDVMLSKKHIVIDSERLVLLKKVNQVSINVGKEDLETSQVIPDHIFRRKRGKKKNYNRIECKKHMKRKIGESGRDDWLLEFLIHLSETRGLTSGETPRDSGSYPLSHHYSVLGLDRFRMNFRGLEQHNILEAVIKWLPRQSSKEGDDILRGHFMQRKENEH